MTFEPHPRRWFQPDSPPFRLMTTNQQACALEALGVDVLYRLPFDADLAGMTDRQFAEEVLARGIGARHVSAGFDIAFGKGRAGNPARLKELEQENAKLKRLVSELSLEKLVLKDIASGNF